MEQIRNQQARIWRSQGFLSFHQLICLQGGARRAINRYARVQ